MPNEIVPFDLQRILLGDHSALFIIEIVIRSCVMYVYALLATRFIGKRSLGQLTPFEYLIVIALGSATGDPMFYPTVPILHGMAVITAIVLIERILTELNQRSETIERVVENSPIILVRNGHLNRENLRNSELSLDELFMQLRLEGVRDLGEVEYAILEPTGKISVFRLPDEEVQLIQSTINKLDE